MVAAAAHGLVKPTVRNVDILRLHLRPPVRKINM